MRDGGEEVVEADQFWGKVEEVFHKGGSGGEGVSVEFVTEAGEEEDYHDDEAIGVFLVGGRWDLRHICCVFDVINSFGKC